MKKKNIRIKLRSYDHSLLDKSVERIIKYVMTTGAEINGPIPLPTKTKIYTVLRSPHVHKKSREQFKLSSHIRFLEICNAGPNTVNLLMKLELASGVEIEIKI
uniref:30S ribosomal protein S10 n=1 Tax=Candidatus Karelsulcia muelleri TaxID=336810 RepID=UPI0032B2FC2D